MSNVVKITVPARGRSVQIAVPGIQGPPGGGVTDEELAEAIAPFVTDDELAAALSEELQAYATTAQLNSALSGKADLVSGVVPTSQIPGVALTTGQAVSNRAEMLALTNVQEGDIVAITGGVDKGTYLLGPGSPSIFVSWLLLSSPTDVVLSVNGQNGTVVLGATDVGAVASTTAVDRVYGTDASGLPITYSISMGASGASVARRNSGTGTLTVATPTSGGHATTKGYVDGADTQVASDAAAALTAGLAAKTPQIDVFTSDGTWTKPAGAKLISYTIIAGGGGGGSGARTASGVLATGGSGGAGGGMTTGEIDASFLGATEFVAVGVGGNGGAGKTNDDSSGISGGSGGLSSFAGIQATGGSNGGAGTATGAASTAAAGIGIVNGQTGGASSATGGNGTSGGTTNGGSGGGGGGGGVTTGNGSGTGAAGSSSRMYTGTTGTAGTANGGTGGTGYSVTTNRPSPGGGGGGGGGGNLSTPAGAGGYGGIYGGGGGGGGGSKNGLLSGRGGNGAGGIVVIVTHF